MLKMFNLCVRNSLTVKFTGTAGMQVAVNKVMKERGLCGGGNVIMYFLSMSISCDQPCIF